MGLFVATPCGGCVEDSTAPNVVLVECQPCPMMYEEYILAAGETVHAEYANACVPCPPEDHSFVVVDEGSTPPATVNRDAEHCDLTDIDLRRWVLQDEQQSVIALAADRALSGGNAHRSRPRMLSEA